MTLTCIEDYIKQIYKETFLSFVRPMHLARYDVPFVQSVFNDINVRQPLTEKQLRLAKLIVLKYTKQLKKRGIIVDPIAVDNTSLGIRTITYEKSVCLDDNIKIKFPYNEELITMFRKHAENSQGYVRWNKIHKHWELAATDSNILWASLLKHNGFDVDLHLTELATQIIQHNSLYPDFMKLVKKNGSCFVENAPPQLVEELQQFNGDMLKLTDVSSTYGYDVSQSVKTQLYEDYSMYGDLFAYMAVNTEVEILPEDLSTAFLYAKKLDRFPLVVIGEMFTEEYLKNLFTDYTISRIVAKDRQSNIFKDKCFLIAKDDSSEPVRLLISTMSMLLGMYGRQVLQDAEKIIWACPRLMNERM
jgi:hypothetical protein